MKVLVLLALAGCEAGRSPAEELASELPATRLHGVLSLDRTGIVANLDTLIAMAHDEPDGAVRGEVIRELGYSGDARVLPVLESFFGGPYEGVAVQSMAYVEPQGCDRLAELWVTSPGEPERPDPIEWRTSLRMALSLHNEACLASLLPYVESHSERVRHIAVATQGGNPRAVVLLEALEAVGPR